MMKNKKGAIGLTIFLVAVVIGLVLLFVYKPWDDSKTSLSHKQSAQLNQLLETTISNSPKISPSQDQANFLAMTRYGLKYAYSHPLQQVTPMNDKACLDYESANYDPNPMAVPTLADGCQKKIFGCTDERAWNYNKFANTSYAGACWYPLKPRGCTDPHAFNYDPNAQVDNGSCIQRVQGCTDLYAANYNPAANTDDGTCVPFMIGCTDPEARNYDPSATIDNNGCWPKHPMIKGCTDRFAPNYDPQATVDSGLCCAREGCTCKNAENYNPGAQVNNRTCVLRGDSGAVKAGSDCDYCK